MKRGADKCLMTDAPDQGNRPADRVANSEDPDRRGLLPVGGWRQALNLLEYRFEDDLSAVPASSGQPPTPPPRFAPLT
jgi:hypothetical protein